MILASVYLGGAYFFLRAATAKQWHTVKGGFVPVGTFATLMGVATILHWDKTPEPDDTRAVAHGAVTASSRAKSICAVIPGNECICECLESPSSKR